MEKRVNLKSCLSTYFQNLLTINRGKSLERFFRKMFTIYISTANSPWNSKERKALPISTKLSNRIAQDTQSSVHFISVSDQNIH